MTNADPHVCFGCQRHLTNGERHIHVGLDQWAAGEGLDSLGFDDLLTFVFCEACTERQPDGRWQLEAHDIEAGE